MPNFSDQRCDYRNLINTEVSVTIIDQEGNTQIDAVCRDYSATGISIELNHPLALGTQVNITNRHFDAGLSAIDCQGSVVRVIEEASDAFLIGIVLSDDTAED
ncbi:PilZ domain-containing protein [Thalassotalea agarivorans]|nr:PilZ domain-containing protein [Thalassotalea agarivorans]